MAAVALVAASAAYATKPGSGSSTGTARVFAPNPVQDLGIQTLTDQKDAATAELAPAYHPVTLTDLDGSGTERDVGSSSRSTPAPRLGIADHRVPVYDRHAGPIEQVMGYYWITRPRRYLQSLGFGRKLRPVNTRPIAGRPDQPVGVRTTRSPTDNKQDEDRFGKGGVDDAEDAEVMHHEYGHADPGLAGASSSTRQARAKPIAQ